METLPDRIQTDSDKGRDEDGNASADDCSRVISSEKLRKSEKKTVTSKFCEALVRLQ